MRLVTLMIGLIVTVAARAAEPSAMRDVKQLNSPFLETTGPMLHSY